MGLDNYSQNTGVGNAGTSNYKTQLKVVCEPKDKVFITADLRVGDSQDITKSKMAILAGLNIADPMQSGTNINIEVVLAGSNYLQSPDYLDQWTLLGFDPFGRPRVNGCKSISATFDQTLSDTMSFSGKANLDLSSDYKYGTGNISSRATFQGGLNFDLSSMSKVSVAYRIENSPNSSDVNTDLAILNVSHRF